MLMLNTIKIFVIVLKEQMELNTTKIFSVLLFYGFFFLI